MNENKEKKSGLWVIGVIAGIITIFSFVTGIASLKSCTGPGGDPEPTAHVHEWGDWIVETPASCETSGVEVRTCILDQTHQEKRAIPQSGHKWEEATFTKPQTCSVCGVTQGSPDPSHTFPTLDEIKELKQSSGHVTISTTGVELLLPEESEMLQNPFRTEIKSPYRGGDTFIMPKPDTGNGILENIADGTDVVVVAKRGEYLFFVSYDYKMGWERADYYGER